MTLKKRASKSITLALAGVTIVTPVLKSVSAMEIGNSNYKLESNFQQEEINFDEIKQMFSNMSGKTRSNIVEINEDNYKAIINTNTGDITHTYYKSDGSILETYSTNFYENLDRFKEQLEQQNSKLARLSGPVIYSNKTSFSPDMLQLQIKQVKKDGKTVHQCDMWNSKNKYKQEFRTKYTSSASVMDFDKAINDASNKWNLLVSVVGTSAALAIASFFVPGSKVTLTALKNGLKALGFTNLLAKADTIVTRWNNYSNAVKNGDNKYNVA